MEELHRRFRQRNFARQLEAARKIKFDTRQAATRPIDRGHDLRGSALCVNQLRVGEELVIVAHNATAAEFAEVLDDGAQLLPRSRGYPKSGQYASSE
jgi:hypothetical protein